MTLPVLDENDLKCFKEHGFLIKRGLLSSKQVENLTESVTNALNWPETPGKWMMYGNTCPDGDSESSPCTLFPFSCRYFEKSSTDGKRILNRLENFVENDKSASHPYWTSSSH